MCASGKREYANARAARTALTLIRAKQQRNRGRREQSIYRCPLCLRFHLTSEPVTDDSDRFR